MPSHTITLSTETVFVGGLEAGYWAWEVEICGLEKSSPLSNELLEVFPGFEKVTLSENPESKSEDESKTTMYSKIMKKDRQEFKQLMQYLHQLVDYLGKHFDFSLVSTAVTRAGSREMDNLIWILQAP